MRVTASNQVQTKQKCNKKEYFFAFNKPAPACDQNSSQCDLDKGVEYVRLRRNLTALGLVHTYPDIFLIRNFFFLS